MRRRSLLVAAAAASLALALTACASPAGKTPTETTGVAPTANATSPLTGEVTVYAAASLRAAFDRISAAFVAENPGVRVPPIVYDGSSTLATQIIEGADVDVFASADQKNMTKVSDASLTAGPPELFATNTLVIAVPRGNPAGITALADLAAPGTAVVLCAPEVPCGAASQTLLGNAGVIVTPASLEQNVTAVLTKVAAGEADAGLVYATDVIGDDEVESIVPDGAAAVVNTYPIATLTSSRNGTSSTNEAAAAFVAFVTGPEGQRILADLGFGAP
ncbi:molybdate ABC transporter substrate-binding protein [Microbacterium rhizomatis]|uniref:Molybdate ABC transporter substrate-binding protein n=1 Tax=Microbacterium rhizomatis TaxID=1631477 RepID=A0A5J5J346_9MICO|nr:molybdate ABC transporter substrate-binding protein [Microbacterium rhizomatis]KAA9107638.1 molybdate ABC transporter substrate-binding protein [Microbacterium rhizomatis]